MTTGTTPSTSRPSPLHSPSAAQTEAARVEHQSASFKKELGLGDLVLQQIVYVVGVVWVGAAAKLGQSHIVFWLLAMLLFYLPQAAVVIHLSRAMPLEGGLYQWTKLGLGEAAGFLVAWNLWMYAVVLISLVGLTVATNLSYAFATPWMASNKPFITFVNFAVLGGLIALAVVGLAVSKWLHNAGSIMLITAFAVLIGLPFVQVARGALPEYHPFAVTMPALSLLSLNIFGKLAVGALSGFEYVAVLAGECKDAGRTIARATLIAAPIIAVMFILGTSAVLAFHAPDQIDLIGPVPQALRAGLGSSGAASLVAPVTILLLTSRTIANSSIVFTGNTRMPMVAGWDRLLPRWFTRLHPRFRTPVNSILFVGVVSLGFGIAGISGVGEQEAFQLLDNAAGILYGLTYLALFALPLVGARGPGAVLPMASLWLKLAAGAGFATTILFVTLSIFPIIDVPSWLSFAAKISGVVVGVNVLGALVYLAAQRRRARQRMLTAIIVAAGALGAHDARAQGDTTRVDYGQLRARAGAAAACDSTFRAARVDTMAVQIRAYLLRTDDGFLPPHARTFVLQRFVEHLELPRPLQLPVFAPGPVRMRMLRPDRLAEDSLVVREPMLYGAYRFRLWKRGANRGTVDVPKVVLPSLVPGFDNSVLGAIRAAASDSSMELLMKELDGDRASFELRVSSGAADARVRVPPFLLFTGVFPRLRAIDARPSSGNVPPPYPDEERDDGADGEAVLRVVVDIDGRAIVSTMEVLHATSPTFATAAIRALAGYRFTPAHVGACAVPQVIEIPFWFSLRP